LKINPQCALLQCKSILSLQQRRKNQNNFLLQLLLSLYPSKQRQSERMPNPENEVKLNNQLAP
jgi:hypothetical protein